MMTSTENKYPKIFVDTNVIIDALTRRDLNYQSSVDFMRYIISGQLTGCICNKQITDIYYILGRYVNSEQRRREFIKTIIETFEVLPLLSGDLLATINTKMSDFEDAVIDEVAKINMIPYIVTNNIKDFENSKTTALTPEQLLLLFQLN